MNMRITRDVYEQIIKEDLEWLRKQPRTLERDHIAVVLEQSVRIEYPGKPDETPKKDRGPITFPASPFAVPDGVCWKCGCKFDYDAPFESDWGQCESCAGKAD